MISELVVLFNFKFIIRSLYKSNSDLGQNNKSAHAYATSSEQFHYAVGIKYNYN